MVAGPSGALGQPVALHDLEDLQADRGGQRIVHVRRVEEELPIVGNGGDFFIGHDRGQGHPGAEGFRQGEDVGNDAISFKREHRAGATKPGLRFVEDEQHPARLAVRLQGGEIAQGQVDDAATAQDRLGNESRQVAGTLGVDLIEGIVELPAPVHADKSRSVGIRCRNGEVAGGERSDPRAADLERGGG